MRRLLFFFVVIGAAWAGAVAAERQSSGRALAPSPAELVDSLRQIVSPRLVKSDSSAKTSAALSVPILMYHHVQTLDDSQAGTLDWGLSISTERFAEQLAWLKQEGYQSVTTADFISGVLPAKPIMLTFDDGYADFYSNAWPLLRQYGFSAIVYVITNRVNQPGFLTDDQISFLASSNVEIGSHTASHPNVTKLDETGRQRELVASRTYLQKLSGQPVLSFCYPSGEYDAITMAALKIAGYKTAVTTNEGVGRLSDAYILSRRRVKPSQSLSTWQDAVRQSK